MKAHRVEQLRASREKSPVFAMLSGAYVEVSRQRQCGLSLLKLAFVACMAAAAIFVANAPGAEHVAFHICDALVLLVILGYVLLRCCGRIGAWSLLPVSVALAWSLALLITLGAPSRRRQLLNISKSYTEACDEPAAAAWIGILLIALPLLVDVPAWSLALLGAAVALQHFLAGVIWPAPECRFRGSGPGGPFLGLSPLWASTLHLLVLTALLAASHRHVRQDKHVEAVIKLYLNEQTATNNAHHLGAASPALSRFESTINQLHQEVQDTEELLIELEAAFNSMPHYAQTWVELTSHMHTMMSRVLSQAKSQTAGADNDNNEQLMRHVATMGPTARVSAHAMSGWVEQRWQPTDAGAVISQQSNIYRFASFESLEKSERKAVTVESVSEDSVDLHLGEWDFDAIACSEERSVFQVVGFHFLRKFPTLEKEQLVIFLELLEASYVPSNSYHSHIHAADMCNAFWFLATKSRMWKHSDIGDTSRIACLIAALGHDIGHFGKNNLFLTASRHTLAVTYNDRSVLENMHASMLQRMLEEEGCNLFSKMAVDRVHQARQLMITLILGTDSSKHLAELSAFRVRLGADSFDPISDIADQHVALGMIFRAADIGHSAKDWPLHATWSYRVVQEFHEQGDEEKRLGLAVSPLCDRDGFDMPGSQCGFLQFICLPTWKELANLESHLYERTDRPDRPERTSQKRPTTTSENSRGSRHSWRAVGLAATAFTPKNKHFEDATDRHSTPTSSSGPSSGAGRTPRMTRRESRKNSTVVFSLTGGSNSPNGVRSMTAEDITQAFTKAAVKRGIDEICVAKCESNLEKWREMGKEDPGDVNMPGGPSKPTLTAD